MQFYYNPQRKNTAAHIWNEGDTYCTMLSTGGIRAGNKKVQLHHDGHRICLMCKNNYDKLFFLNHVLSID
jgi:hypothetical protein